MSKSNGVPAIEYKLNPAPNIADRTTNPLPRPRPSTRRGDTHRTNRGEQQLCRGIHIGITTTTNYHPPHRTYHSSANNASKVAAAVSTNSFVVTMKCNNNSCAQRTVDTAGGVLNHIQEKQGGGTTGMGTV